MLANLFLEKKCVAGQYVTRRSHLVTFKIKAMPKCLLY